MSQTKLVILPKAVDINQLERLSLPSPVTNEPISFFWNKEKNTLFQTVKVNFEQTKSWITHLDVHKDGSYFLLTEIDVVFLLVSLFEFNSSKKGEKYNFIEMDSIPLSQTYQERGISSDIAYFINQETVTNKALSVCDLQEFGSTRVFSLNREKTLTWLEKKISSLVTNFDQVPELQDSIQKTSAQLVSKPELLNGLKTCETVAIISKYLSPSWEKQIFEHLNLDKVQTEIKEHCASLDVLNSLGMNDYVNNSNSFNTQRHEDQKATKITKTGKAPKGSQTITNFFKKA